MAKRGAKRKEFDLATVEGLGRIQCTNNEVAAVLGIDPDTVYERLKEKGDFYEALEGGRNRGRASLRRLQMRAAEELNPTMLIWLGKQCLDQTDRLDLKAESKIKLEAAPDLSVLSVEELKALKAMSAKVIEHKPADTSNRAKLK